jgi:hypothetical protein
MSNNWHFLPDERCHKLYCFLLQLLNSNTSQFECSKFLRWCKNYESDLFRHILTHCPHIRAVEVTSSVYDDIKVIPRPQKEGLFRMMASQWKNLTYLKLEVDMAVHCVNKNDGVVTRRWKESSNALIRNVCLSLPNLR